MCTPRIAHNYGKKENVRRGINSADFEDIKDLGKRVGSERRGRAVFCGFRVPLLKKIRASEGLPPQSRQCCRVSNRLKYFTWKTVAPYKRKGRKG